MGREATGVRRHVVHRVGLGEWNSKGIHTRGGDSDNLRTRSGRAIDDHAGADRKEAPQTGRDELHGASRLHRKPATRRARCVTLVGGFPQQGVVPLFESHCGSVRSSVRGEQASEWGGDRVWYLCRGDVYLSRLHENEPGLRLQRRLEPVPHGVACEHSFLSGRSC